MAELGEKLRCGYVRSYGVVRSGLHTSEDMRCDYRIVITYNGYNGYEGWTHEGEVEDALFPVVATRQSEEDRRGELASNHRDMPIHEIDPHASTK